MMQKLMQKKKLNELLGLNNHNHDQQKELLGRLPHPRMYRRGQPHTIINIKMPPLINSEADGW